MPWSDTRSGSCFNCGEPGHLASDCPAKVAEAKAAAPRPLSDADITGRITRFYEPASDAELRGLIATWRRTYKPGIEYPEAPRYPGGFLAVLTARQAARAHRRSGPAASEQAPLAGPEPPPEESCK